MGLHLLLHALSSWSNMMEITALLPAHQVSSRLKCYVLAHHVLSLLHTHNISDDCIHVDIHHMYLSCIMYLQS
jgi:hypothetical protein